MCHCGGPCTFFEGLDAESPALTCVPGNGMRESASALKTRCSRNRSERVSTQTRTTDCERLLNPSQTHVAVLRSFRPSRSLKAPQEWILECYAKFLPQATLQLSIARLSVSCRSRNFQVLGLPRASTMSCDCHEPHP